MFKEIMICITIITSIIVVDILTQNFTKKSVSEVNTIFENLKKEIVNNDKTKIDEEIKTIEKKWNDVHDILSYYIEHDEIEKVDTAIVTMKAFLETDDFSSAIAEIDEGKFVLEHIQEKYAFNLENIF